MTTESPVLDERPQTAVSPQWPRTLPYPRLLPAVATSALLWMCHFPLAWGWLAWVALVPFLCLVRSRGNARLIYFSSWAAGLWFFFPALQWMRVADYRMYWTWMMLAIYCSAYFPVALWLIRKLDRKTALPLMVSVPVVWVGLEFVRSFLLTGFAWYYLGHTQHDYLAVIQITDLTGVYGVSFLIAMANAWLFETLHMSEGFRRFVCLPAPEKETSLRSLGWQTATLAVLIVGALSYGMTRLEQEDFKPGPRLALLQGSLDQRIREEAVAPGDRAKAKEAIFTAYYDLCKQAISQYPRPDLLVWPETSYPGIWIHIAPQALNEVRPEVIDAAVDSLRTMTRLVAEFPAPHLVGVNLDLIDDDLKLKHYNSAMFINDKGKAKARYDKIHRVPFGEYVPLLEWFPFMQRFAPYDYDYSVREGKHLTRFELDRQAQAGVPKGSFRFGVLICFEDSDPFLARRYMSQDADGPPVDFFVNISNDGWFDGTSEHEEHLAICRFRAIECRRAVARAVNMGISAIIDSNGRVQQPQSVVTETTKTWVVAEKDGRIPDLETKQWSEFKKAPGVLMATVPIDNRFSLYTVLGDWLPCGCWILVAGCLAVARVRKAWA